MSKIIAIGGGEISESETLKIDQEIINFSGKISPKLLFIPTASNDATGYFDSVKKYFENLGCSVDVLYLIRNKQSLEQIEDKILNSDIVYVGGGNTLKLMTVWRKMGVDRILEKALKKNVVLSGLSAGSICWFAYGNSDSRKFSSGSEKLIKVTGLNFINTLHCPHYDVEPKRQEDLKRMMKNTPGVAIALENCCAIQVKDDKYRFITSKNGAKAYKVYWKKGEFFKEEIIQRNEYLPMEDLLKK